MMTKTAGISSFHFLIDHSLILSRNLLFRHHVRWLQQFCSIPPVLPFHAQHAFFVPADGVALFDGSPLSSIPSGRSQLAFASFSIATPGNHTIQILDEAGNEICSQSLRSFSFLHSIVDGVCSAPDIRIDRTTHRMNGGCDLRS